MFYPYGFGFGSHWLLYIGVPLVIGIWAQIRVSSAFSRWGKVRATSNITGAECAREILQAAQIHDVDVVETNDFLGDHYDPTSKKLCLSSNVYSTPSVAALGIAAHETGHAIQHAKAYAPLKARMAIVPVTMVASQMLPFVIIGGLFFHLTGLSARAKSKRGTMEKPKTDEDQQLVARTQSGDASAFDQLVVKYTPRLYGLVYNMTSNHEDTNDLLQDIFSKAYKAIRGFRGKSSFYTWIHSIAVNMTLNFLKKRGRRFQLSLDDVDASIQNDKEFMEATATSSPVREADLSELQRRLNEAMMKLSDDHRAVVTMFHIQGMPHAEISKILRVSEGTVRSRLFYANRQLQNYLDEFRKNPVS